MRLETFLESLSHGELSGLWLGEEGLTGWSDNQRRRVISYMNQGLKALSSRFCLLQREVLLDTQANKTMYFLRREYAQSSPVAITGVKYLDDSNKDPFVGDVVKILRVFDAAGCPMVLNDEGNVNSLFTPAFDTLQIPSLEATGTYSVIYQALHPMLQTPINPDEEFNLQPQLEEALSSFVGWKAYQAVSGEPAAREAARHKARFDEICIEAEINDLVNESQVETNAKLELNGWE